MMFFADPAISLSDKLLECVYILIGLITIYAGLKNLFDRENPSRFGTFVFWTSFGVVCAFGKKYGVPTPFNARTVEIVHELENGAPIAFSNIGRYDDLLK